MLSIATPEDMKAKRQNDFGEIRNTTNKHRISMRSQFKDEHPFGMYFVIW